MRKLFGTDGVRGTANNYPITPEVIMKLGKAAAIVLKNGLFPSHQRTTIMNPAHN